MIELEKYERILKQYETQYHHLTIAKEQSESEISATRDTYWVHTKGREIVQEISAELQERSFTRLAQLITMGLETVFPDIDYKTELVQTSTAGKTQVEFVLTKNGKRYDPIDSVGGGVTDVISFMLRCAAILMHRPPIPPVLILDEPFKFVSVEYRANVKKLIEKLSEDLGIQFINVTHMEELVCGTTIRIG